MLKAKVAVLVSGGGTNLQALIDSKANGLMPSVDLALVIADRSTAFALKRAAKHQIAHQAISRNDCANQAIFESRILQSLADHQIDIIVLAGFLAILSPSFIQQYPQRIINIHPSLIPAFCGDGYYGLKVHEAALERGVKLSGATVHFVNEVVDGGAIISQKAVEVLATDSPQSLQQRIMEQAEWQILPLALEQVANNLVKGGQKSGD